MSKPETDSREVDSNVNYWATRWSENRIGWHSNGVNPMLMKYLETLTGSPDECDKDQLEKNSKKKFFVPLCGKTRDLAYLLSLGFQVFAIEGVVQAIENLAEENNFKFIFREETSTYETADKRLIIFYGDLFKCPIEKWGPFDFVWDRGSLIALDYFVRVPYIKMMQRSVQNSDGSYHAFRYLLETVEYDRTKFPGPPRAAGENDIQELYGDWTHYKFLERVPLSEGHPIRQVPDMGPQVDQLNFILTPKL